MLKRRFCRVLAYMLSPLLAAFPAMATAAKIQWEVANRYRLFKSEDQFRTIADVFQSLPESARQTTPALALENELERRAASKTFGRPFGDAVSVARYGWASALVGQTCFQQGNKGHWPSLLSNGDQFLIPKTFDLIGRVRNLPADQASAPCSWRLGASVVQAPRCDADVRIENVPFEQRFSVTVIAASRETFRTHGKQPTLSRQIGERSGLVALDRQ